jgi:HlyD family secretion protein
VTGKKKLIIAALVVLMGAAIVAANLYFKKTDEITVNAEAIQRRDLEAVVSASGKIQPKRSVNISADSMGRVVNLVVNEGDRVKQGQFLLQIDPRNLRTRVQSGEAGVEAAQRLLEQIRVSIETARAQLALSQENLKRQRELWAAELTTREALDRAENEVKVRESDLKEREAQARTQEVRITAERAGLENARYDLSKVRIESPIDGIVTRRNIEEGETVVVGTMNNPGTQLLTIADMSILEGEVEVDETNIPTVQLGQVAKITIDALPDKSFKGKVTEIGNSPIQTQAQGATARQATNFKVVVTLDDKIPDVRPGFTCTADITTATRSKAVAVPIPAVAVRELVYDANGQIVKAPPPQRRRRSVVEESVAAMELKPGQTRKETEGVFLVRDGKAVFAPVKVGIAGDKYFEVLDGLKEGDRVITGPYNNVRGLKEGDAVKIEAARSTATTP